MKEGELTRGREHSFDFCLERGRRVVGACGKKRGKNGSEYILHASGYIPTGSHMDVDGEGGGNELQ